MDKNTGRTVWSYDTRLDAGPRSFHGNPLIFKDLLYIATDHGCGATGGGYVYAFEKHSGKRRWMLKASGPATSFAQIGDAIFWGTREDEWISADMISGRVNWNFHDYSPDPNCDIPASPVTDGENLALISHEGIIVGLNSAGHRIWSLKPASPPTTGLFMYKDVLYFGTQDRLIYGINPANGKGLHELKLPAAPKGRFAWSSRGEDDAEYVFATSEKNRGMVLAFSDEFERVLWSHPSEREWSSEQPHVWKNWVIAGNCQGEIAAFNLSDGTPAWTDHVKGCIRSFGHDSSTLYIGVQEGTVYAYRPPMNR